MIPRLQNASPLGIVGSVWKNRGLIWEMTKRDVVGRYRGSIMGLLWSLFNPILMLGVYTFAFSVVFQARWGEGTSSKTDFAVILFAGLIVHTLFAECINRAPSLILSNVNYVKKVVFPLQILPLVAMGSALFHALISVLVLLAFFTLTHLDLRWTAVFLPLVLLPFVCLTIGLSWFLASVGVFVRDVGQATGILTTVMLFLSPVFYPLSGIPESYRYLLHLNPLTFIIEQARDVLIWGKLPDWAGLGLYALVSLAIACLGWMWFQITRKGFADVV